MQVAAIPEEVVVAGEIRENDVEHAVVVEIVDGEAGAVAVVKADGQGGWCGDVVEVVGEEGIAAGPGPVQGFCRDGDGRVNADGGTGDCREE